MRRIPLFWIVIVMISASAGAEVETRIGRELLHIPAEYLAFDGKGAGTFPMVHLRMNAATGEPAPVGLGKGDLLTIEILSAAPVQNARARDRFFAAHMFEAEKAPAESDLDFYPSIKRKVGNTTGRYFEAYIGRSGDEDVFYGCTQDTEMLEGICVYDGMFRELSIRYSFSRVWLKDWRRLHASVFGLIQKSADR